MKKPQGPGTFHKRTPTRSYHRYKKATTWILSSWGCPSSKFLDETFQVFWSYVAFPTQMLRTTDGQADAHGDDLSILYGAGRCVLRNGCFFQSWKKMGFPKIWGFVTAFVLFKMQKKRSLIETTGIFKFVFFGCRFLPCWKLGVDILLNSATLISLFECGGCLSTFFDRVIFEWSNRWRSLRIMNPGDGQAAMTFLGFVSGNATF